MDDNELEARLRTHLHQRFDATPVPSGLATAVRAGVTAAPTAKVGFALRRGALQLGRLATIAVVVVAVGTVLVVVPRLVPANPGTTTTQSPGASATGAVEQAFIVLPANGRTPSKAESEQADAVFQARLRALGLESFTTAIGNGYAVHATVDGVTDGVIREVLAANGDVEFVPLPPTALRDGDASALVGKRVPSGLAPLFGSDGIASAARGVSQQGFPTIDIELTATARDRFAEYTTNHQLEYVAIVIDGTVVSAPVINEPITGGQVSVTSGSGDVPGSANTAWDVAVAIMAGGRLPEAWRNSTAPEIITREAAIARAKARGQGDNGFAVTSADLDAWVEGSAWRPLWRVGFSDGANVTLDAVTGEWLATGIP